MLEPRNATRRHTFSAAPQHGVFSGVRQKVGVRPGVQVDRPLVYGAERGVVALQLLPSLLGLCRAGVGARRRDAGDALAELICARPQRQPASRRAG